MSDELKYVHLIPESSLPAIASEPYRMVVIAAVVVSPEWQALVSAWIVRTGCHLYDGLGCGLQLLGRLGRHGQSR